MFLFNCQTSTNVWLVTMAVIIHVWIITVASRVVAIRDMFYPMMERIAQVKISLKLHLETFSLSVCKLLQFSPIVTILVAFLLTASGVFFLGYIVESCLSSDESVVGRGRCPGHRTDFFLVVPNLLLHVIYNWSTSDQLGFWQVFAYKIVFFWFVVLLVSTPVLTWFEFLTWRLLWTS